MLAQEINHLHAPEVGIEILFAIRGEEVSEQGGRGSALRDRFQ